MNNPSFVALVLLASALAARADSQSASPQQSPVAGSKTVKLCDNKTTVQVADDAPKTRAEGQKISDALMAQRQALTYRYRLAASGCGVVIGSVPLGGLLRTSSPSSASSCALG